ncbi:hypothetical protein [Paenibacillus sp. FSL P4-0184]|uniref:hypothetical protein n=1 Tax=Paenibacillus sp. FSL P4-0184 TaxID=2921632 RepID=UPI0030F9722D
MLIVPTNFFTALQGQTFEGVTIIAPPTTAFAQLSFSLSQRVPACNILVDEVIVMRTQEVNGATGDTYAPGPNVQQEGFSAFFPTFSVATSSQITG